MVRNQPLGQLALLLIAGCTDAWAIPSGGAGAANTHSFPSLDVTGNITMAASATIDGRDVQLSWKLGEARVAYMSEGTGNSAKRVRIPRSQAERN